MRRRPARVAGYCARSLVALGVLALCVLGPSLAATAAKPTAARVHPQRWARLEPALARDADLERRIATLISRMTPAQKVGQLIQADIDSITPDDLAQYPLGSVLNGGNSSPHGDKLAPPREWLALADRFYDVSVARQGSPGIPLLWGTDAVHGHNNIPGATVFPTTLPSALRPTSRSSAASARSPPSRCGSPVSSGRFPLAPRWPGGVDQGDNPATETELRDLDGAGYYAAIEHVEPASVPRAYSAAPAPTATQARSRFETDARSKLRAAAVMRTRACPSGIGGAVSPFFGLWKRSGLMRATT